MRALILLSCGLALATAGCGGRADCTELAKTWCARAKECGATQTANCENFVTSSCIQLTPAGCTEPADASECVSAASSESCDQVLAGRPPSCTLRCKGR